MLKGRDPGEYLETSSRTSGGGAKMFEFCYCSSDSHYLAEKMNKIKDRQKEY